jgi:hypothetical protein
VASFEGLSAWALDRCIAYTKAHKHPELADSTICRAFEAEPSQRVQISGPFDAFPRDTSLILEDLPGSASTTTSTRSLPEPPAGRSRSRPMLIHRHLLGRRNRRRASWPRCPR